MEVRANTELGLKNVQSEGLHQRRTENPAGLPGSDYSNRMIDNLNKEASSIRPSQTKDYYKTVGSTIDKMA